MNHIRIVLQIIILFFGFSVFAESVCTLLAKDIEARKYSFKCSGQLVNVQCENKNKVLCGVTIKDTLKTMRFNLTEDEFKSFNLFSSAELAKTECETKKMLCTTDGNTCGKYKTFFQSVGEPLVAQNSKGKRCEPINIGESAKNMSSLSGGLVSSLSFDKNSCNADSEVPLQSLKSKVSLFKKVFAPSIMKRDSLLYGCAKRPSDNSAVERDKFVSSKTKELNELKKRILGRMNSATELKTLACGDRNEIFYSNGGLDIHKVMCAIVEESALSIGDPAISCGDSVGDYEDDETGRINGRAASAALAKADSIPLEQKPMPEIMASQVGKPIGLTPALAQVDQAVPGSGTVQGSTPSESNIASGAVRGTFPNTAAIQAGQAFAPVYEKLSKMANAVTSSSSGRTGVIGRSNSPKSPNGASGVVTVSRKLPTANSDSSIDPSSLVAASAASGTTAGLAKNSDADPKAAKAAGIQRSVANDAEVAPIGGPRAVNLGGSTSGGSRGIAANVAAGAANSETVSSAALASVQKKITQLNTPAKVISFFKEEAVKIPDFRSLLYSDATSSLLASKGIRVVNQSGEVSGEKMTKAKYVFSDDGTKFTKLNVGKKN